MVGQQLLQQKNFKEDKKQPWLWPENGPLSISQLLYEYPTCLPEAYVNIKQYIYNDNLNFIFNNDKCVARDLKLWCSKLNLWTSIDFDNYYKDDKVHPYFNAYNRLRYQVHYEYYDINTSVEIANKLLLRQFDDSSEIIYDFLTDL